MSVYPPRRHASARERRMIRDLSRGSVGGGGALLVRSRCVAELRRRRSHVNSIATDEAIGCQASASTPLRRLTSLIDEFCNKIGTNQKCQNASTTSALGSNPDGIWSLRAFPLLDRLCCKSLKTPGDKFPARSRNKPRSLIDVASGALPKSPVS
jgi:hypothetical protein